ncbi:MAG TPA: TrbI/VirB10 family protein [Bryobacteraceae bacterium]|nr:TrbI/VirB10 family protein [Bryobacteraceae bacterium]
MAQANTSPQNEMQPPPMPNPQNLQQGGLSNRHKRYIYFGVAAVILLLILANLIGSNQGSSPRTSTPRSSAAQQQNPSAAQIRDWENNLKQTEGQLQEETREREQQLNAIHNAQQTSPQQPTMTAADLQRAATLEDSALAHQQFQGNYGTTTTQEQQQKSQIQTEKEQQAYKSLFADNIVRQDSASPSAPTQISAQQTVPKSATAMAGHTDPQMQLQDQKQRKALDFSPSNHPTFWLPEGTVMEAVLTNRLDGDAPGPVNCMITTDVYLPGTRMLLIPQGARVLGDASKVSSFGQQRLAVSFHRIFVPGLHPYSIPLDKDPSALGQSGEAGLHDKANNHYISIFGASLAVGAIGGLAQIANGYSGFGYDPSVAFRNGVSQSTAESSDRVLDRFLNRMPSITIREGTRVKIILTDDLQVPSYESMHTGGA